MIALLVATLCAVGIYEVGVRYIDWERARRNARIEAERRRLRPNMLERIDDLEAENTKLRAENKALREGGPFR